MDRSEHLYTFTAPDIYAGCGLPFYRTAQDIDVSARLLQLALEVLCDTDL